MKKHILRIVALTLSMLLLASCGTGISKKETITNPHETDSSFTVAVIQLEESPYYAEIRKAFIARMRVLGYDEAKMKFDIINAQGDTDKLNSLVSGLSKDKYDLLVPISEAAAQAVSQNSNTIPAVFVAVKDPVALGLTSSLTNPDKNMTGTTCSVSVDDLFVLMKILTPNTHNIGIVYSDDDVKSGKTVTEAEKYLTDNGYTFEEMKLDTNTVDAQVTDLLTRTDIIFIPDDIKLENSVDAIMRLATTNGKPTYACTQSAVTTGALAAVCISSTDLAKSSALLADKVLQGNPISSIPVTENSSPVQYISKSAVAALSVEVPTLENTTMI